MVETIYKTVDGSVFTSRFEAEKHENKIAPPARTLEFRGHSDDVIVVENALGEGTDEEYYNSPLLVQSLDYPHKGLYVHVQYTLKGCWMVGLSPIDEDVEFPDWNMEFKVDGYSTVLVMEVPVGVTVTEIVE